MEEKQNIKVGVSPTIDNQLAVPTIQSKIALIRDQQVLLDRDLARFYGVEVSQMNRQVKRNIERFPEDFMFQLTKAENEALKCQYGILKTAWW